MTLDIAFADRDAAERRKGVGLLRAMKLMEAKVLAGKLLQQQRDGLAVYRPFPSVEKFHASRAHWRMVVGPNRGGKTVAALTELARAVRGMDPYDKYPKRDGRFLIVAKDVPHLGNPIWEILAGPGAFKTIRDLETKRMRAVRWRTDDPARIDPSDWDRRREWKPSEPLIPPRDIMEIAWEEHKTLVPKMVKLNTGWEIWFRSGGSSPPRGIQLDGVLFDEEFDNQAFWGECNARLVDRNGVGIWSGTPDVSTPQFAELWEKSQSNAPGIEGFQVSLEDNPMLTDEAKKEFYDSLSDEDREIKYYGRFSLFGRRVYSCYRPDGIHGCEPFDIPETWCRYVFLDPARQQAGTVLAAIDPQEEHVWIYDAFELKQADANRWADLMVERQGDWRFEAMVIDERMGRQKHAQQGERTVADHYWAALQERKVEPRTMGPRSGFFSGSDDIPAREEALLNWMRVRESGPFLSPKLQVFKNICPNFHKKIKEAYYDRKRPDKRVKIRLADLIDALEYGAAMDPRYYPPEAVPQPEVRVAEQLWKDKQERTSRKRRRHALLA